MQVFDGEDDLRCVELGLFFREALFLGEESEQFSSWAILESEEELLIILEGVVELDDEGVVHADEDVAFGHDMVFLFSLLDILLLEDLHGVDALILFALLLDEDHLGIGSLADDRQHVEVVQRQLVLLFIHHNIHYYRSPSNNA